jgi:hypothetical protein
MANETVKTAITKRGVIIMAAIVLGGLSIAFHTALRGWLCESAWFHSTLIDGPALVLVVVAWKELSHSEEANGHRKQMSVDLNGTKLELAGMREEAKKANDLREKNIELGRKNAELNEKLTAIQQEIADNLKRQPTKADRNAAILKKYMRKLASVSQEGTQPVGYEIVEISEDNIATLFLVRGAQSTRSISNIVDCGEMTIQEAQQGGCSLRIHINKFIGQPRDWGQIARWEDRDGAAPPFDKAANATCNAVYGKGGSAEIKTLNIFQAKDGTNFFQLESSDGWAVSGDNVQVSKDFMATQVEYFAANFTRNTFSPGGANGGHKLFVC